MLTLGLPRGSRVARTSTQGSSTPVQSVVSSGTSSAGHLRTRTRLPLSLAVLEAVPLSALTPPDSSRYQENNSVNQQCHAGHYPKRGECVAYLGLWLPSLVPSCYARKVVCSPARYKSHTPHYIAREWADLPFFFCIRVSRSPSRHSCDLAASKPAARPRPQLLFFWLRRNEK